MIRAIVVALTLLAASAASAEEEWADLGWGIGLSVSAHGWELRGPAPSDGWTGVVAMRPVGVDEGALCQLEYRARTAPPQTREELNAATRGLLGGPAMERARAEGTVEQAEINDVGGVAVFDARSRIESQQTLARRFWLQRGDELRGYMLLCLADEHNEPGIRGMEAIAASLRFWEQQQ